MTERAKDPSYIEEVIRSQRSAAVVETYRWMLTMRDLFMNIFLTAWNLSVGAAGAIGGAHWKLPLMHTVLPPNGPAIIKLLYEIHAFQVFDTGGSRCRFSPTARSSPAPCLTSPASSHPPPHVSLARFSHSTHNTRCQSRSLFTHCT